MYCFFDEETQIAICYFPDEICTYYPDGTVECVPRASANQWVIHFSLVAVILVSIVAIVAIAR